MSNEAKFTQKIFVLRYPDGKKTSLRCYLADEVDLYVRQAELDQATTNTFYKEALKKIELLENKALSLSAKNKKNSH